MAAAPFEYPDIQATQRGCTACGETFLADADAEAPYCESCETDALWWHHLHCQRNCEEEDAYYAENGT